MKSKRVIWISLLIVAAIVVSQASAAGVETDLRDTLPSSTLYDGYVYYGEEVEVTAGNFSYMQGRINFAVYDTTAGNEWEMAGPDFSNPGNGKYVYAYQIYNDYDEYSEVPIQAFSVLGLDGDAISVDTGSIGTHEDARGGQDASGTSSTDTSVTWNFNGPSDYIIGTDEHSFYLIFSSNSDWVAGDYSLDAYDPLFVVPGGEGDGIVTGDEGVVEGVSVPEPVTVALLGLGGLVAVIKRKRK